MLIVSTLFPADSGGAAEEAGSDRRLRLCRRAQSPEHLQQALLQANIHTGLHSQEESRYAVYIFLMNCGLFVFLVCLLSQRSEGGFPQHIIQAAGEAGMKIVL